MTRRGQVLKLAMDLPAKDRVFIMKKLVATLPEEELDLVRVEREWAPELARRSRELETRKVQAEDWSAVRARILASRRR